MLCQNATTLVVGNMYQLNFTVYNHVNMNTSEIRVLVNGKSAFNHTTPNQNALSNASYIFTAQSAGYNFTTVASNYSCWYDRNREVVEIQRRPNLYTTKMVELAYSYPYVLCQNISLVVGNVYQLNFTVFNQLNMTTS